MCCSRLGRVATLVALAAACRRSPAAGVRSSGVSATIVATGLQVSKQHPNSSTDVPTTYKIWIAPDKIRADWGGDATEIIDRSEGKVFHLQPSSKRYSELDREERKRRILDDMKARADLYRKLKSTDPATKAGGLPRVSLSKSEEMQMMAGHGAARWAVHQEGGSENDMSLTLWVARDLGLDMNDWADAGEAIRAFGMFGEVAEQLRAEAGFPLRIEEVRRYAGPEELDATLEVKTIQVGPVDPAVFAVPADFRKVAPRWVVGWRLGTPPPRGTRCG